MPNLLKMNTFSDFLVTDLQNFINEPIKKNNRIDNVASCVTSMIKMAQSDHYQLRTSSEEFRETIRNIQSKVEEIHRLLMSEPGQKADTLNIAQPVALA